MKKREITNMVLHIVVGGALAALVYVHPALVLVVLFVLCWLREQAQHRYDYRIQSQFSSLGDTPRIIKTNVGFFGWQTGHRIFEVFQWLLLAAPGIAAWELYSWLKN